MERGSIVVWVTKTYQSCSFASIVLYIPDLDTMNRRKTNLTCMTFFFSMWFCLQELYPCMSWDFLKNNKYLYLHSRLSPLTLLSWIARVSLLGQLPRAPFKLSFSGNIEWKNISSRKRNLLFIEPVCCKFNPRWCGASVIVSDISLLGVGPDGLSQHTAELECEAFDLSFDLRFCSHPCWATSAGQRILQAWVSSSMWLPVKNGCNAASHWSKYFRVLRIHSVVNGQRPRM